MSSRSTEELAEAAPSEGAGLTEVQQWMVQLLYSKKGLAKSTAMKEAAARHFTGNERLLPAEQIEIYRRQFWLRHTSLLVEDFPGLTALLGQKAWEAVAESYLTERGYDVFALRDLPEQMPAHLASLTELPRRQLLIEMAELECAYLSAFHAPNDAPLDGDKLAKMPEEAWATARIVLSPSLRLVEARHSVAKIRRQLKDSPALGPTTTYEEAPQNLVVYRRQKNLWDKSVSKTAFRLLQEFQKGTALIAACEAVATNVPEAAKTLDEELFEWFALWGRLGWIIDVIPAPKSP